jgi:drug/metabolite transporter (DMT)-like permease
MGSPFFLLLALQQLEMVQTGRQQFISWGIFVFLAFIWGSSFILIKKSLFDDAGNQLLLPVEVALLRIVISMLALLPGLFIYIRRIPKTAWKFLLVVGLCGNGLPAFFFSIGQTQVSSSLAGILNSIVPLFTLLLGGLFFGLESKKHNRIGVFIGFLGTTLIIVSGRFVLQFESLLYPFLITLATLCYAISLNTIKRFLTDVGAFEITSAALFLVGVPAAIALLFTGTISRVQQQPALQEAVGYTALLAVFGTAIALVLFNRLIKVSSALFASSVTYFIPLIAVLWGWLDGESLVFLQFLGAAIVLFGVFLVYKK